MGKPKADTSTTTGKASLDYPLDRLSVSMDYEYEDEDDLSFDSYSLQIRLEKDGRFYVSTQKGYVDSLQSTELTFPQLHDGLTKLIKQFPRK